MAPKNAFYVPCLRWRLAERQALAALSDKAKDSVVPLITIPDLEFDFEDGTPKKTVGEHVGTFPKRYKEKWKTRKAWIDADPKIQTATHTRRDDTIDLCQSHLWLRPRRSIFGRNTRSLQLSLIARPTLGKKQPQRQHDRYFAARQRQRYEGLAVRGLAQRRGILRSDTNRMRAFLGYCSVVDHQHGIAAADEPVCLDKQFGFHRRRIPNPGCNEVMQLIACAERKPLRHRLHALAVAGTDQSRHVKWAHLTPCFVTQPIQKRLEPTSKLVSPIQRPANHGRPLHKPTTHESRKN